MADRRPQRVVTVDCRTRWRADGCGVFDRVIGNRAQLLRIVKFSAAVFLPGHRRSMLWVILGNEAAGSGGVKRRTGVTEVQPATASLGG